MIPSYRQAFNAAWTAAGHQRLLDTLARACGGPLSFAVSETPCFFERGFIDGLANTGVELVQQLDSNMTAAGRGQPGRARTVRRSERRSGAAFPGRGLRLDPDAGWPHRAATGGTAGVPLAVRPAAPARRDLSQHLWVAGLARLLSGRPRRHVLRRPGRQRHPRRARSRRSGADGDRASQAEDVAGLRRHRAGVGRAGGGHVGGAA